MKPARGGEAGGRGAEGCQDGLRVLRQVGGCGILQAAAQNVKAGGDKGEAGESAGQVLICATLQTTE